jgi:uncharacterized protein YfdQ (DUF2303 family)
MSDGDTDAQVIVDTAIAATAPRELSEDALYSVIVPGSGRQQTLDLERFQDEPDRTRGTVPVADAPSFIAYYERHAKATEPSNSGSQPFLYAHQDSGTVQAVFNDDTAGVPGWRDHRVVLTLAATPEWKLWAGKHGTLMSHADFAEHIEDGLSDIETPPAADMLELAQSFQARTKVAFQSGYRTDSGQRALEYVETTTASAGQNGKITIPEQFTIGVAPWEGAPSYRIQARLRYRIENGNLRIGYVLVRPHEVLRAAFTDVIEALAEATGATAVRGVPADSPRGRG